MSENVNKNEVNFVIIPEEFVITYSSKSDAVKNAVEVSNSTGKRHLICKVVGETALAYAFVKNASKNGALEEDVNG